RARYRRSPQPPQASRIEGDEFVTPYYLALLLRKRKEYINHSPKIQRILEVRSDQTPRAPNAGQHFAKVAMSGWELRISCAGKASACDSVPTFWRRKDFRPQIPSHPGGRTPGKRALWFQASAIRVSFMIREIVSGW